MSTEDYFPSKFKNVLHQKNIKQTFAFNQHIYLLDPNKAAIRVKVVFYKQTYQGSDQK